eukprot:CAMPEP_0181122620 /NCGR_PEP_ID=MMETSP1071-20121207/25414_1 /TAXON_ID=35127 /ORGANISM="Thalassiosira sp., Strain NH16" /LENGTH=159 /DNA_ID=CAMNT_0023207609 /DNA_START=33 /DNA_END=509 /DNA_ORIENTATION=-
MNTPVIALKNEGCMINSESASNLTEITSSPSDNDSDSACDGSQTALSQVPGQQGRKKSVRFSSVYVREYNVVEDVATDSDEVEGSHRSLGWSFSETESDLETHMDEIKQERKEQYLRMIHEHIQRAERQKEVKEANEIARQQMNKKKGFKSKVLKPLWK